MNILDYKLYVFDLDGVIIYSEKLHWDAYKKLLEMIMNILIKIFILKNIVQNKYFK